MKTITRVAVVGAGTMGAAIAAHLANSGRAVLLLDAAPEQLSAAEAARGLTLDQREVRDRLARAGLERVQRTKPPAFLTAETAQLITCGNVEDDLAQLDEVDWIIEAITERLDVKRALYERIDALRRPGTIVSSNTSGLPISQLVEGRSDDFQAHFLGTHFFNPPRQMKLLEITPIASTLPSVVEAICQVGERDLGKGIVICKDTPNFISNRIGTMDLSVAVLHALEHGYTVEEVDLLTGPLIGRPRTGTFRLLDLIGVDVMALINQNLHPRVPNDETRDRLIEPSLANLYSTMVERGWLGNKAGIGFYQEVRTDQGRAFWPLDLTTLEHRPPQVPRFEGLTAIEKERDLPTRLRALVALEDRAGAYVRAILASLLGYASRRLPEIADDVRSVDRAMRWGFNHALGPFEVWDALGVAKARELPGMDAAPWVDAMLGSGHATFYQSPVGNPVAEPRYWSVSLQAAVEPERSPNVIVVAERKAANGVIVENPSASLVDIGDGVAALELHTKMNTLDDRIVEMIYQSLDRVAGGFAGMVVTGQGAHFSAGANLAYMAGLIQASDWSGIERVIKGLQDAFMALRFSPQPVVIAPFGWTLGGGAELAMAGSRIVASAETFFGQVEVGVGLIPAAGGCKELLRRVASASRDASRHDRRGAVERVFDLIWQGTMTGSAAEARSLGFLVPADRIVMNPEHLLATARREVQAMADAGFLPPRRGASVYAAGRDALAALRIKAYLAHEGGRATDYDVFLADRFAQVLCGGDLSESSWVDEQYILDLERATFVDLCRQPQTQERVRHFLQTGKTLHN